MSAEIPRHEAPKNNRRLLFDVSDTLDQVYPLEEVRMPVEGGDTARLNRPFDQEIDYLPISDPFAELERMNKELLKGLDAPKTNRYLL